MERKETISQSGSEASQPQARLGSKSTEEMLLNSTETDNVSTDHSGDVLSNSVRRLHRSLRP